MEKSELELKKEELQDLIQIRANNLVFMGVNRDDELAVEIREKIQAKIQEIKTLEPDFFEFG